MMAHLGIFFFVLLPSALAQYAPKSTEPTYTSTKAKREAAFIPCDRALGKVKKGQVASDFPECLTYNRLNLDYQNKGNNLLELAERGCSEPSRNAEDSFKQYERTPDANIEARLNACKDFKANYRFNGKEYCTKSGQLRRGGNCPPILKRP